MKTLTKLLKTEKTENPKQNNNKNKAIDPVFKQQAVVLTAFDYFNYGHSFSSGDR